MGAQQSKDALLYEQVNYGNVEGIKTLRRQGAGLEWMDKEGKTPLILACLRHDLLPVAKVLIELGANVNVYRPGNHAGTPLHHAAKKGLEQTVHFLLSHGANPFTMNDDCHTALDLAREKGHFNVVRAIESRISIFSGWLREHYGPGFLEAFAPQLMSRKIWAVVLPCDARNPTRPLKFQLVIYPELKVAKPRTVLSLWKCTIEEPKFNQSDPSVIIIDKNSRARYKFLSAHEGDKQQLQWFYTACRGITQVNNITPQAPAGAVRPNAPSIIPYPSPTPAGASTSNPEDVELAMAINASIQSAIAEGVPGVPTTSTAANTATNGWGSSPGNSTLNGWGPPDVSVPPSKMSTQTRLDEP
ncbi:putative E3 ubiquitin-protein ligase XBOS34, partial [Ananas comosus]